jgi:hypothetical protein
MLVGTARDCGKRTDCRHHAGWPIGSGGLGPSPAPKARAVIARLIKVCAHRLVSPGGFASIVREPMPTAHRRRGGRLLFAVTANRPKPCRYNRNNGKIHESLLITRSIGRCNRKTGPVCVSSYFHSKSKTEVVCQS